MRDLYMYLLNRRWFDWTKHTNWCLQVYVLFVCIYIFCNFGNLLKIVSTWYDMKEGRIMKTDLSSVLTVFFLHVHPKIFYSVIYMICLSFWYTWDPPQLGMIGYTQSKVSLAVFVDLSVFLPVSLVVFVDLSVFCQFLFNFCIP